MAILSKSLIASVFLSFLCVSGWSFNSVYQPVGPIPGKFIVKFSESADPAAADAALGNGNRLKKAFRAISNRDLDYPGEWDRFYVLYSDNRSMKDEDVIRLLGKNNIEYVEPDYNIQLFELPQDSLFSNQWYLHNTGQWYLGIERLPGEGDDYLTIKSGTPGADIRLVDYYANPPTEHTRVVVAVLDTGVDPNHPELQGQFWTNIDEIPDNGIDDDHNGYVDDIIGWDVSGDTLDYYFEPSPDNVPNDLVGHGTHVAGIVAARADTKGVVGVAPNALVMAISLWPNFCVATAVEGIVYAVNSGARIINVSWGTRYNSEALYEALQFARRNNVFVSMAAGNSGDNVFFYPQAYDSSFCVAAGNSDGYMTEFTTFGPPIDVVAPGLDILSLRADSTDMYAPDEPLVRIIGDDSLWYLADGTSMSAPVVCGAAALLLAVRPELNVSELEQTLRLGATDILDPFNDGSNYPGPDTISGFGYLNVDASLALLQPEGIFLVQPVSQQRYPGDVVVKAAATGGYTGTWQLDYAMAVDAVDWLPLASDDNLPTDSVIYNLGDEVPDGHVHLRLTDKYGESSVLSFYHVSRRVAAITAPAPGEDIKYSLDILGSAYGPDFDSVSVTATLDGTTTTLALSTRECYDSLLYAWTIGGTDTGQCTIEVTAYYPGQELSDAVTIHLASVFTPGWPVVTDGYGGPGIVSADLNRDGVREVIVTTSTGVFAFHADGTTVNGFPVRPGVDMRSMPAIYDVDRDGQDEIICTGENGIHVLKYDGTYADGWPQNCYTGMTGLCFPNPVVTSLDPSQDSAIVIINRDGEILAYEFNGDSYFYALEGFFASFNLPPDATGKGGSNQAMVTSTDFNGDGQREVLAAYTAYNPICGLGVFDGRTGNPAYDPTEPLVCPIDAVFGTTLTDLDGDSLPEVVALGKLGDDIPMVWVKTPGFADYPGWPVALDADEYWSCNYPAVADLDMDGIPEVLCVAFTFGVSRLYIFRSDGTPYCQLEDHPYGTAYFDYSELSAPVVANLHGDEYPEIVCFSGYMFPGAGRERIHILDHLAKPTPGSPLQTLATVYQGFSQDFPPLLDDIDQDGLMELIVRSYNGDVLCWDFDGVYEEGNIGRFLVDNLNSNILWPSYQSTDAPWSDQLMPSSMVLAQNYPNPFNPETIIRFELPRRAYVQLDVYNILGQRVRSLINEELPAGSHVVTFDGSGFASGIYLYRLTADQENITRKMVLVK